MTSLAGIGTSTLTAQTTINANCNNLSTGAVTFAANYDPITANKTTSLTATTGYVSISCVKGTASVVSVGLGNNASGSVRRMKDTPSGDFLVYELYQPSCVGAVCTAACTTVWGTSGGGLFSAPASLTKSTAQNYPICAAIAGGQNPAVGSYADIVLVTVSF